MKRILRIFLSHILAVYLASIWARGLSFNPYFEGVIITGSALGLARFTLKPIIKVLLLPITLATLGLFSFVSNIIVLYVVDLALDQFAVQGFSYPGLKTEYFAIPSLNFSGIMAYVAFAILISIFISLVNFLRK